MKKRFLPLLTIAAFIAILASSCTSTTSGELSGSGDSKEDVDGDSYSIYYGQKYKEGGAKAGHEEHHGHEKEGHTEHH